MLKHVPFSQWKPVVIEVSHRSTGRQRKLQTSGAIVLVSSTATFALIKTLAGNNKVNHIQVSHLRSIFSGHQPVSNLLTRPKVTMYKSTSTVTCHLTMFKRSYSSMAQLIPYTQTISNEQSANSNTKLAK